jgi:hypothetical protein
LDLIEPVERQIQHFSPQLTPGGIEYLNMFNIVFTGLCGERGFQLWAEEKGLLPTTSDRAWKEDFIVGRKRMNTEIKTFKSHILKSSDPHVPYWKIKMIMKHSNFVVFCKVSLNRVSPNLDIMSKWYTQGTDFHILGWHYTNEMLGIDYTDPKTEVSFPIERMMPIQQYIEMAKCANVVDNVESRQEHNNFYKFKRIQENRKKKNKRHKKDSVLRFV